MKTYSFFNKNIVKVALFACCATLTISSCEEEIDSSNFAIKTEQTIADILDTNKDLSMARDLFKKVPLGKADGSSVYSVLSARGNYTAFIPDNVAMENYLRKLEVSDINELLPEQAQLIVFSCVIDNGDQNAYESTDFPTSAAFNLSNLYDRLLTCEEISDTIIKRVKYDELTQMPEMLEGDTVFIEYSAYHKIDKGSCVMIRDREASNGILHVVSEVIAPITDNIPDALKNSSNMQIMGLLLQKTGIAALLTQERDLAYEEVEHPEVFTTTATFGKAAVPLKRYIAYTGFVETDDIFINNYGVPAPQYSSDEKIVDNITNADEIIEAVKNIPEIARAYPSSVDDLTNPENGLYKFVQYHFINGKLAPGKFVAHNNEFRYKPGSDQKNPQMKDLPIDVWDYYTTIGEKRSLVKILQKGDAGNAGIEHPIYINRFCTYDNGFLGTYDVVSVEADGIEVFEAEGFAPSNGYVYPISDLLLFGDAERKVMGKERMRIDFTTIFHEVLSNNARGGQYMHFPQLSETHTYFDNLVRVTTDTKLTYLHTAYGGANWKDYQGDEFLATGLFDFTIKLPPVPVSNEYEIRMYASHNAWRGMAQLYIGDDINRLLPAGLPYDMRQSCSNNPAIPWVADVEGDDLTNIENDKNLRQQGYMKAPNYFVQSDKTGTDETVRNASPSSPGLRRIVTRQKLEPEKTYYLRYKSALKKMDAEWFLDFIEIVPKEVYDGATEEDIW